MTTARVEAIAKVLRECGVTQALYVANRIIAADPATKELERLRKALNRITMLDNFDSSFTRLLDAKEIAMQALTPALNDKAEG